MKAGGHPIPSAVQTVELLLWKHDVDQLSCSEIGNLLLLFQKKIAHWFP